MGEIVKLKCVRGAFLHGLFEARAFEDGGKPKFNATFIIDKGSENDKLIRAAINKVAVEEWKDKAPAILSAIKGNTQKCAYTDGDLKGGYDGFEGKMALSAGNPRRPRVVDIDGKTPLDSTDGRPYSGCYNNVSVEIWAQSGKYQGLRCELRGVQYLKDGDSFTGGGVAAEDEFDDLSTGADAGGGMSTDDDGMF